jgi:hypothetical protein
MVKKNSSSKPSGSNPQDQSAAERVADAADAIRAGSGDAGLPAILIPTPETQIAVTLDNEHLIAVVVARTEIRLKEKMQKAVQASRQAGSQADRLMAQIHELHEKAPFDPDFIARCETLVRDADELDMSLKVAYSRGPLDLKDLTFVVRATFTAHDSHSHYGSLPAARIHRLPPETRKLIDEIEDLRREQADQTNIARDARSRLTEIPAIERNARAKLAEYALRKTAAGSEMLDALLDNLDAEVDAMPILRQLEG